METSQQNILKCSVVSHLHCFREAKLFAPTSKEEYQKVSSYFKKHDQTKQKFWTAYSEVQLNIGHTK